MKIEEISKLEVKDLHSKLAELRKDFAKKKLEIKVGKSNEAHILRNMKKDIARILTVLKTK